MNERLFQRKCVVIVGAAPPPDFVQVVPDALRIEGLRCVFRVEKTAAKEPNSLDLAVYNLSERSRSTLHAKGIRVVLQAGHQETVSQVFSGEVRTIDHTREGPNWVTRVRCGDGERTFRFARLSESWGPGVPISDVCKKLVSLMQLDPGNSIEKLAGLADQFASGHSVHGKAEAELDRILAPRGYGFSIQDGRIEILAPGETTRDLAVVLAPETGLIGSPERCASERRGGLGVIKLKSLLQPLVRPGRRLTVRSASLSGDLRVEKVTHTGDTAGADWYSEIEAVPAS